MLQTLNLIRKIKEHQAKREHELFERCYDFINTEAGRQVASFPGYSRPPRQD